MADRSLFEQLGGIVALNYEAAVLEHMLTQPTLVRRITENTPRQVNPVFRPTRQDLEDIVADDFMAELKALVARFEQDTGVLISFGGYEEIWLNVGSTERHLWDLI